MYLQNGVSIALRHRIWGSLGISQPSSPNEILSLDLGSCDLALLRARLDLRDEGLFLPLQLRSYLVELTDRLVKQTLVLPQTLGWRYALAECPLEDLSLQSATIRENDAGTAPTFMITLRSDLRPLMKD